MTPPTPRQPALGRARIEIRKPDTTSYSPKKYLSGDGARANHSKAPDGSGLAFTANALEAAMAANATILEDAFAVVEFDEGGVWTPKGTPYLLAPGSGTVRGDRQAAAREHVPVGIGALHGLASECIVLPKDCDETSPTIRYASGIEGNRYLGWQSRGFTEDSSWHNADVFTPASGAPKDGEPESWDTAAASAAWVYRNADEGGLTLLRIGTFTLASRTVVKFIAAADEEMKVYLDGPNMGGVIIDSTANETGYTDKGPWKKRLEPGTYRVSAEFTSVDSTGGDGNDSLRFACGTVDDKGNIATVLLQTSSSTRVHRQAKNDERPGFTPGELLRRLLEDNQALSVTAADILLSNRTFTDSLDSAGDPWDAGREWVWPLGTPLSSVLADLVDDCDLDLTTDFEFQAWNDRGADVSATVSPTFLEYRWDSEPRGRNGYLTLSQDGYDLVLPTITDGARRSLGFLESGASASIGRAKRNARSAIRQTGRVRRYYQGKMPALTGSVPYTDFALCDVVHGLGYRNLGLDLEVTDIAWEQGSGTTLFTLELGEV